MAHSGNLDSMMSDNRRGDRRRRTQTEETTTSQTSSLHQAMLQNLALEEKLESDYAEASTETFLQRMLSLKSVVSTSSSFAERQQAAVGSSANFREIGTGSIGKIFEHPGTLFVYKLPLTDMPDKLWNNYIKHKRIENSFTVLPFKLGQVEIPKCHWYATPDTKAFWDDHLDRFPDDARYPRQPRHVLCMERIYPLPKPIREALIDKYCPEHAREQMAESTSNKDCLIRPYLGRIRHGRGTAFFSLRNFKLHADQAEDLNLDMSEYVLSMAHAMAVLHWHTCIDGNDIEFVLGSSPMEGQNVRTHGHSMQQLAKLPAYSSTYEIVTHSDVNFKKRVISL